MVSTRQSSNMGSSNAGGPGGEAGDVSSLKKQHSVTTVSTSGISNGGSTAESRSLSLLDLPVEILEKIFGSLGFNTVAHMRLVNMTLQCER